MKKSFMTRVLAMGLSFAMAFSLSAATNVTTASAAAKKVGVTTMMKVSTKSVTEGKSVKTYMNSTALKKYRIKKVAKLSAVADKYIDVDVITSGSKNRQGLEITAHDGAVTAAKLTKKGVYVTIYFAQTTSAKKAAKATAVKYAKLKVAVQAKPVEKLTMTVKATHANEIVATFSKAVGSDAKVTLKKATTDVANTAKIADDGKSATITLTGKLTEGTYTVTVVAGDETDSKDLVAQNEKLDSFKIGSTVKEKTKATGANVGTLTYEALNQYGDRINYTPAADAVTVSIGEVDPSIKPCKTSGAGEITIKKIPDIYAIPGQSFTVVIVDTLNNTGTTVNTTAVYGPRATASEFTKAGVYSVNKSAFKDVADGDVIYTSGRSRFELLFSAKDQYGDEMKADAIAELASEGAISVTIAGGLTNIKAVDLKGNAGTREVNDVTYFAVPLKNVGDSEKANAGTYTVSIVNNTKGIVYSEDYTVTAGTVIASIDINQKDVIYADQENELDYSVVDTDGKEIKDYATLKNINVEGSLDEEKDDKAFTWKKKADGTAKLVYKPAPLDKATTARDYTKSEVRACKIEANKAESGKFLVKSKTFSVYYQREAVAATGLASSATTVTTDGKLDVKLEDLVILDQYQNPYTATELKSASNTVGKLVYVVTKTALNGATVKANGETLSADNITGAAVGSKVAITNLTKDLKLNFFVSGPAAKITRAMENGNDFTATFSRGDSQKVSGLYIDDINGGCPLQINGVSNYGFLVGKEDSVKSLYEGRTGVGYVVVKGIVNGKKVTIAPDQYSFVGAQPFEFGGGYGSPVYNANALRLSGVQSYELAQKIITETREFSIVVSTADGTQTITGKIDVSNAPVTAKSISAKTDVTTTFTVASADALGITKKAFSYASADALFTTKTNYNTVTEGEGLVTFAVESAKVSGASLWLDTTEYKDGSYVPASEIKSYMDGSNKNYLYVNGDLKPKAASASALIITATVESSVAGTDSSASKTISLTINY